MTDQDILNKPRNSVYPMISMSEAEALVISNSQLQDTEKIHYMSALNRVCAEEVLAREPLPPFAASIKDGFAIKLTSEQMNYVKGNSGNEKVSFVFEVIGISNAGDELINVDLKEGQCVKINTGAPVPLKADAVIQIEDTISLEKTPIGKYDSGYSN